MIVNDKLVQAFNLYQLKVSRCSVDEVLIVLYLFLTCLADVTGPLLW